MHVVTATLDLGNLFNLATCRDRGARDKRTSGRLKLIPERCDLQVLKHNSLISFVETTEQFLNLLLVHSCRAVVEERTADKTTLRVTALELLRYKFVTLLWLVVDRAGLVESGLR